MGYNVKTWAREAYTVVVDIDSEELKKDTIRADLPICADASKFMEMLLEKSKKIKIKSRKNWLYQCSQWKQKYPVVSRDHYKDKQAVNIYAFMDFLSKHLPENSLTVVANGSASVVGNRII